MGFHCFDRLLVLQLVASLRYTNRKENCLQKLLFRDLSRGKSCEIDTPASFASIFFIEANWLFNCMHIFERQHYFCSFFLLFFSEIVVHKTKHNEMDLSAATHFSKQHTHWPHWRCGSSPFFHPSIHATKILPCFKLKEKGPPSFLAQIWQIHDYSLTLLLCKWLPDWIFSIHKLKMARVSMTCSK